MNRVQVKQEHSDSSYYALFVQKSVQEKISKNSLHKNRVID